MSGSPAGVTRSGATALGAAGVLPLPPPWRRLGGRHPDPHGESRPPGGEQRPTRAPPGAWWGLAAGSHLRKARTPGQAPGDPQAFRQPGFEFGLPCCFHNMILRRQDFEACWAALPPSQRPPAPGRAQLRSWGRRASGSWPGRPSCGRHCRFPRHLSWAAAGCARRRLGCQ